MVKFLGVKGVSISLPTGYRKSICYAVDFDVFLKTEKNYLYKTLARFSP